MGPKQRTKPKPSIFMAKPKKAVPTRIAANADPVRRYDRHATDTQVESHEAMEDAALTHSVAMLKDQLECAQPRTKLASAVAATPAFDDRKDFPSAPADFDVPQLLQVGGFDEWWRKAELMLISEGHFTISLREAGSSADTAFYTNGREPARLLKRYIGKDVLSRVPTEALAHIHSLIPVLRQITSKPFRLLDLPAELRVRILEMAVERKHPIYLHAEAPTRGEMVAYKQRSYYQPAICRSSRQLREESMPIFFKTNEFRVIRNFEEPAYPRALYDWSMANKKWLSTLRRVTLQVRAAAEDGQISMLQLHLTYDPDQGLRVDEAKADLHDSHIADLHETIARINAFGKAHGMEGEMLTMFWESPQDFSKYLPDTPRPEGDVDMEL